MVSFLPLNPLDEESISMVMLQIDNAIQYGEDLDVKIMKVQYVSLQWLDTSGTPHIIVLQLLLDFYN